MSSTKTFAVKRRFSCDTVVIGGGTTGIAAAIASARNGARTMLIEACGYLGGTATVVPSWMGFHACDGTPVVKGIPLELLVALQTRGGATPLYPDPICGSMAAVNTHWWKIVADEQISRAGVQLLLHTRFVGVEKDGRCITCVYLFGGEGLLAVDCKYVIDCTDTGIVAMESGEKMTRGRTGDGKVQVSSWTFDIGNIDFPALAAYFTAYPDDLRPFPLLDATAHIRDILNREGFVMGAFGRLVAQAKKDGMRLPRNNMPGVIFPAAGKFVTVASRVENVDPADSPAYTRAEREGAAQVEIWLEFLKKYVPGFEHCTLSGTYGSIGIRETNHLAGVHLLTAEDLLTGRRFDDAIALGGYHLDIHSPDHDGIETRFPPIYTIPYRSLLPLNTANLLVAGRAISATHEAQASTRVIPISMAEGEAAGTAAALGVASGVMAEEVSVAELQKTLIAAGALIVPPSSNGEAQQ